MIEAWLYEFIRSFILLLINPLLYWIIIFVLISGYLRIKKERLNFGIKVFDIFTEWKNTWTVSIIAGIIISLLMIGTGIVFSYSSLLLLCAIIFILSLTFKPSLLSASYTIGITYLLLLFSPLLLQYQTYMSPTFFSEVNFMGLTVLVSLLLFTEAVSIRRIKRNETYPTLSLSNRGKWIGKRHLRKLNVIPILFLIPGGKITSFAAYWPLVPLTIGDESFHLLFIPFLIGFNHTVKGKFTEVAAKKISNHLLYLGLIVLLLAVGSMYVSWLTLLAIIVAIIGREIIVYTHRNFDREHTAYFNKLDEGLKILAVIPNSPAERLGLLVGETVARVNGQHVNHENVFYEALQSSGAFFKLDIVDDNGEVRFVQSVLYEGDHHELGIIFTNKPHQEG